MRAYSSAVVASALNVQRHWLDSLIATHHVPGLQLARQGRSRAIPPRAVLVLAITRELITGLGLPVAVALEMAVALADRETIDVTPTVALRVDVAAIERRVALRLNDAVDANPPARRGRPPRASVRG